MNGKKAVTIGLLTITTIGLVACAINFSKKKNTNKQNTEQVTAIDSKITYLENQQYLYNTNVKLTFDIETENTIEITNQILNKLTIKTKLTDAETPTNSANFTQTTNTYTTTISNAIQTVNLILGQVEIQNYNPFNYKATLKYNLIYLINNQQQQRQYTINDFTYQDNNYIAFNKNGNTPKILTINTYTQQEIDDYNDIFDDTYDTAYQNGYSEGYDEGNQYGYGTGYNEGQQLSNPIDIRGLMLNILTMPFTFIRQGFNVTMWEGTAYQFNVANFILALIAIATILFIIRLFTSGLSIIGNYTDSRDNRAERRSRIELNKAKTRRENNLADKGK